MRFVDSFLYDDESILIPRKGTLNNIIYQNSPFWTVDTMFWSIIDKAKAFPKYLFYQLTLTDYSNLNVGSAVPSLTVPVINQIEVNLPPLPEQRAIAEVLGSLDDKIDLLHRQNQTLEALAETLFRQWFIEEADPAWEEVKLGSVIETTSGGTPSRTNPQFYENGTHCWVKSKELKGNILLDTEETITDEAIKKSSAKMLPKYSVLIAMYGANVSEYALIAKPMACNQAICALKPNDNYPYSFLFLYVKNMKEEIEAMAVGSAQQNISQILIKQLDIIPPSTKILDFHEIVNPWFLKIEANYVQIKHLEKTRDELLPKLMSGDVRVSQVNLNGETQ
jgi:type I restriction enzyme S subunit